MLALFSDYCFIKESKDTLGWFYISTLGLAIAWYFSLLLFASCRGLKLTILRYYNRKCRKHQKVKRVEIELESIKNVKVKDTFKVDIL